MEHANAEKGEGVHHIAIATPSFDDAVAIHDVFSGMPGDEQAPDAT